MCEQSQKKQNAERTEKPLDLLKLDDCLGFSLRFLGLDTISIYSRISKKFRRQCYCATKLVKTVGLDKFVIAGDQLSYRYLLHLADNCKNVEYINTMIQCGSPKELMYFLMNVKKLKQLEVSLVFPESQHMLSSVVPKISQYLYQLEVLKIYNCRCDINVNPLRMLKKLTTLALSADFLAGSFTLVGLDYVLNSCQITDLAIDELVWNLVDLVRNCAETALRRIRKLSGTLDLNEENGVHLASNMRNLEGFEL